MGNFKIVVLNTMFKLVQHSVFIKSIIPVCVTVSTRIYHE